MFTGTCEYDAIILVAFILNFRSHLFAVAVPLAAFLIWDTSSEYTVVS